MRYLVYFLVIIGVTVGVSLIPSSTEAEIKYADAPRIDTVTVQNVKLICVENRCYDLNKLPSRYRALADQQAQPL